MKDKLDLASDTFTSLHSPAYAMRMQRWARMGRSSTMNRTSLRRSLSRSLRRSEAKVLADPA